MMNMIQKSVTFVGTKDFDTQTMPIKLVLHILSRYFCKSLQSMC